MPFGSISCCSIGWNGPNSTDGSDNNIGFSGSGKGGGSGGWGGIRGIGNGNGGSFDIPVYENPPGGGGGGGGGSCSNGANDYPTCTNCTVSTDTNYNTGPCSGTCSNGAIDYSTCVTFGGGCFTAGTMILTPKGQEPIEKLKPGDVVETWNTSLNKMVESPVVNTYSHKDIPTFLVITTSGLVNTTSDHRFWTGNMWMEAGRLIAGSSYLFDSNGHKQRVLLTMNGSTQSVYNLQVASSNHDYFANGYLVHNIKLL